MLLWIITFAHIATSYRVFIKNPRFVIHLGYYRLSASRSSGGGDDGYQGGSLPIISTSVINVLDKQLGEFMTSNAIKTVGFYMLEFHDDTSNTWMTSFMNYSTNGFPDNDWTKFLELMIQLPTQSIDVTLEHTKRTRNKENVNLATNVSLHYIHELEPKKIAHRIVAVREDISNELMQDLCSIKLENQAAMKYANTWLTTSREEAETQRSMTRGGETEGSTPYRDRNFFECSVLVSLLLSTVLVRLLTLCFSSVL